MEPYLSLSLIAGFSVASFLFAAAESAFFSLSQWQTRRLAKEHANRGKLVSAVLANPKELISDTRKHFLPTCYIKQQHKDILYESIA